MLNFLYSACTFNLIWWRYVPSGTYMQQWYSIIVRG